MLTSSLFPYQEEAADRSLERGSLLIAYSMGLGKTIISLAVAEDLFAGGLLSMALLVVPASLKWQWAQAIAKHTDVDTQEKSIMLDGIKQLVTIPADDHCVVVDGTKDKRFKQLEYALAKRPYYVVLGYENVVNDWSQVRKLKPELIVADEITAIKTFKSQRTRKIKRLTSLYRIGLTGTPIENGKPEELFSIMQWIDPEVLGRFDLFDRTYIVRNNFGAPVRYKNLPVLHEKMSDVMVRKTRGDEDVAPYLPITLETTLQVKRSPQIKSLYRRIADETLAELSQIKPGEESFDLSAYYSGSMGGGFDNSTQGRIMSRVQAMDMLLDHPDLVIESGEKYERSRKENKDYGGSKYCWELWQSGALDDVFDAPKIDVLREDLEVALADPSSKAIVFSFYVSMLDILADELPWGSVRYSGKLNAAGKTAAVARFQADPDCRLLLSSHAGTYGTDLYMASHLYNYDLAWSSGRQDQINARHERVASNFKHIYVRNLITWNSTEPRKYETLQHKRRVGSAILDGVGADVKGRIENDVETLTTCLQATR